MGILEKIKNLFKSKQQENVIENLEDILLESDINNEIVIEIINKLTK
ncbi:signal recognition particle receptor subunit alpha, partial [Borreliella burgdorferi]